MPSHNVNAENHLGENRNFRQNSKLSTYTHFPFYCVTYFHTARGRRLWGIFTQDAPGPEKLDVQNSENGFAQRKLCSDTKKCISQSPSRTQISQNFAKGLWSPVSHFSVTLKDTNQPEVCKEPAITCQVILLSWWCTLFITVNIKKTWQRLDSNTCQFSSQSFSPEMKNENQTHLSVTRSQFYLDLVTSLHWPTQSESKKQKHTHTHVMSPKSTHTHKEKIQQNCPKLIWLPSTVPESSCIIQTQLKSVTSIQTSTLWQKHNIVQSTCQGAWVCGEEELEGWWERYCKCGRKGNG